MSIKLVKVHLHVNWEFDMFNSDCAICRNSICDQSLESDKTVLGVCGHAFHHGCISSWLNTKNVCPLCNKQWEFKQKSFGR